MKKYPYQNTELKNIKGERWKDIPGLEMYFKISNYGRIKRLKYQLEYSDGRQYIKPEKIIKPVLMKIPNRLMKDNIYFLQNSVTLFKQKYNFSIARLLYHCFKEPIQAGDYTLVILPKDGNGQNLSLSNLMKATLSEKQQRVFDWNRRDPPVLDENAIKRRIEQSRLANNKQVTQYSMQGRVIKTYPSIAVASKKTGISQSHISDRARGNEYSAGGFIWRFGNATEIDLRPMFDKIKNRRQRDKEAFGKKVTQYTMTGQRVSTYPTINDAAKAVGIRHSEVSRVIQKRRASAGGFYWLKGEGPQLIDLSGHAYGEVLRAKNLQRPVQQYSKQGKPLQRFDSVKQAAKAVGVSDASVIGALKGRQQTSAGFRWEYYTATNKDQLS